MMAAEGEGRGMLSFKKRTRNVGNEPSTSGENPGKTPTSKVATERRGKLSLKRKRNGGDWPSTSRDQGKTTRRSEVCDRSINVRFNNNSRVDQRTEKVTSGNSSSPTTEISTPRSDLTTSNMFGADVEFRQSFNQEWTSLPDLPPWFGFKGKEKEETQKHETIKIGNVSIEWRPLPKHCQLCLVRTRQKRVTQLQELSTGPLSLKTQSAKLAASDEQVPVSVQRSKTSRNGSENNVTKETAKESYLGRTVRKVDLPGNGSENDSTSKAKNVGVPTGDNQSKSFQETIDAGKLQMKRTTIKKPVLLQNLAQDQKKEQPQAEKCETQGFNALPASFKTEGKDKSVELIEEVDLERERSRRKNMQGSHSSTVKTLDVGRTLRKEDLPVNGSENRWTPQAENTGVHLPLGDKHSKSLVMNSAGKLEMQRTSIKKPGPVQNLFQDLKKERPQAELIEEFDPDRERSRRKYRQGVQSDTVKKRDSEATRSLVKNPSNESYANLCVKDSDPMKVESSDTRKELIEEFDFEKVTLKQNWGPERENSVQPDKVFRKALDLTVSSQEIIVLDSDDDDDEILPPSPIKQGPSSRTTSKRKLSEASSERDKTAVKKPKLVDLVSTGPGTSGSLTKRSIPDQKSCSSSMAGQKQFCGETLTSQTIKTAAGKKTTKIRNDSQTFPNRCKATKKPLFKRKLEELIEELIEEFTGKTDGSSSSIGVPNLETRIQTTLPNRQNFTQTNDRTTTASASMLLKSFGQKASAVQDSYHNTINPNQAVRGTETPRRVPAVANQWTAKTDQSGFQTANDIWTNRDIHSRPSGNHQGSDPKRGINTTHTPSTHKGINRDKHSRPSGNHQESDPKRGINTAHTPSTHKGINRDKHSRPSGNHQESDPKRGINTAHTPSTHKGINRDIHSGPYGNHQESDPKRGINTAHTPSTHKDINRDIHSGPYGNHQGSDPKRGINTTHTPSTRIGINRDIQHPVGGINQDQQANQGTKQDGNFKQDSTPSQVIKACPYCTEEFEQGLSLFQRDSHIALCLSQSFG